MIRLSVLYKHPTDAAAFEQHYDTVHMPLARTMPNLKRMETARVMSTPGGGEPAVYRIADLYFGDEAAMNEALRSEVGRATSKDMQVLATGGVEVIVCEVDN